MIISILRNHLENEICTSTEKELNYQAEYNRSRSNKENFRSPLNYNHEYHYCQIYPEFLFDDSYEFCQDPGWQ